MTTTALGTSPAVTEPSTALSTSVAWMFLLAAAVGTAFGSRQFVKIRIGHLYILEAIYVAWLLPAVWSLRQYHWVKIAKPIWPILLFCGYGSARLFVDLFIPSTALTPLIGQRIAQHAIIVVYPFLWAAAGAWLTLIGGRYLRFLMLAVFLANIIPHFFGENVINVSLGPLITILFFKTFMKTELDGERRQLLPLYAYSFVLAILTFLPFWRMWMTYMQRTSLILLLFMIAAVPQIMPWGRKGVWPGLRVSLLTASLFAAGIVLSSLEFAKFFPAMSRATVTYIKSMSSPTGSSESWAKVRLAPPPSPQATTPFIAMMYYNFAHSMQHGEDVSNSPGASLFQIRTRGFMWRTAVNDWWKQPLFGRGFIPEIPSYVRPNLPNAGNWGYEGAPPVTGPHNSYLLILARTGIIGLCLFLIIFVKWSWDVRLLRPANLHTFTDALLVFIPVNGLIHAFVNVGFESPHNCVLIWLAVGALMVKGSTLTMPGRYSNQHP